MTEKKPKTAAKTKLEPGTHSIDRAHPRELPDGTIALDWSVRLHNGRLLRKRTKGPKKSIVRARARQTAKELLETPGGNWKPSAPIIDYIDQAVIPRIEKTEKLKDNSRRRHLATIALVKPHLKGFSIWDATTRGVLEQTLQRVAKAKPGSVDNARTVLSKWVVDALVTEGVIKDNPIFKRTLDLPLPPQRPAERRTLTEAEWDTVIQHLLTRDTTALLVPSKHKNLRQSTKNKHSRIVRLTLLQSVTGMRISEATLIKWKNVIDTPDGIIIDVPAVKGKKGTEKKRRTPIFRDDVTDYLRKHRGEPEEFVAASPADALKRWDPTNADDCVPPLYAQIAEVTGVEILKDLRSHSWRATLHGVYADVIDPLTLAKYFGHTQKIADEYYDDLENTEAVLKAVKGIKSGYGGQHPSPL